MAVAAPVARRRLVAAFAAVYILWGSTYLAVALGLRSIPPLMLMGARSVLAGLILLGVEQCRRPGVPPGRAWASAAVAGFLLFVGCHGTLAYAQQRVPSGLAAVILATIPFWIVLLNFLAPAGGQRPNMYALLGLAPGLAGVALIAWRGGSQDEAAPIYPTMVLLLVGSALSWAAGSLVAQRQGIATPAIVLSGMQLVCGGVALLLLSALASEWDDFTPKDVTAVSWAGLAYLTIAGSVLGFTAYVWLLDHAPGPLVATYTFVNPIIAVALGWALLGERLSPWMLVGVVLVIGSVVAEWRLSPTDRRRGPVRQAGRVAPPGHADRP
jgi:drug/metabolite transporter (DMT)-like permease